MDRLFRSRMEYVRGPREEGCFLCRAADPQNSEDGLVLRRGDVAFVIINKYPYNTGHLVVSPNRHVGEIERLTTEEQSEMQALMAESVGALRKEFAPDGFNIGANLGEAAGAGLPDHFHWHVVPRWIGDTNFMPVTAGSKVLPESLQETFLRLGEAFKA